MVGCRHLLVIAAALLTLTGCASGSSAPDGDAGSAPQQAPGTAPAPPDAAGPSAGAQGHPERFAVSAMIETAPVPSTGDAADDPAIWVHPSDPARSTVIGTDKDGGLGVYDLQGSQLHYYPGMQPNNVDLRYGFPLGGGPATIVAASDRLTNTIRLFSVDPESRGLKPVGQIGTDLDIYGLCMYRSARSGTYSVFATGESGGMRQWELFEAAAGRVDGRQVRQFQVGSKSEGCVADDEAGHLYVGEEEGGLYKYGAESSSGEARTAIDSVTGRGGRIVADIEGLALLYGPQGQGYLVVSSQGSNDFVLYDRSGDNRYLTRFSVAPGPVDGVSETDGLDILGFGLGEVFPDGLFVVQDGENDTGTQNFKLVSWSAIAEAAGLEAAPGLDPRSLR